MVNFDYEVEKFYRDNYELSKKRICKYGIKEEDAEDIIQTALFKAIQNFNNTSSFNTYLYKIISNDIITFLKNEKIKTSAFIEDVDASNVERTVIEREIYQNMPEIRKLWVQGYTYKEIGEKLNMTLNQVKYELRKNK